MVSIFWLNYNSLKIKDVILKSLEAVIELDYPKNRYGIIVVDNGSSDGSFELIKNFLNEKNKIRKKIIKCYRNLGFAGGNNLAYRLRNQESRYVVFLNNDAIPTPDSLRTMIEFMEKNLDIGAVQGIILNLKDDKIDNAGNYISELLTTHPFLSGRDSYDIPRRPFYITYADGAYSAYRVDALKRAVKWEDRLFHDVIFAYCDDNMLGLKIWNAGFKVASIPTITARHLRGGTFNQLKPLQEYLLSRGLTILIEITNSRYKDIIKLFQIRWIIFSLLSMTLKKIHKKKDILYARIKGIKKGYKIGNMLKLRENIDIYGSKIVYLKINCIIFGLMYLRILRTYIEKYLQNKILFVG
ncbi:MAG: glycosyltransferase family 2 protein [Candidatus Bathyarchaeia archaeon]